MKKTNSHYKLSSIGSALLLGAAFTGFCHAQQPDFGPNVTIFDPTSSPDDIKTKCDAIYSVQQANQFGSERNAIFFKPGSYDAKINIGFYTQIYGLGKVPDDVNISSIHCDAKWMKGNATCNFWRGCENFSTGDGASDTMWAVSQAAPFRRMHVRGKLTLFQADGNPNWSSGGYMADSLIDGKLTPGSQQQWFSRNSAWESWSNGVWNMVFVGNVGNPDGTWPERPYTVVDKTPIIREKPYLFIDSSKNFSVFVPALRKDSAGISWGNGQGPGKAIPISAFYIARSDKDTAATINAALSSGKNLLLTPGVYQLDAPIKVTHPDTVVLGIGMPTLNPVKGTSALEVADVDGVSLACVLLDAGSSDSPVLLQVGPKGSNQSHAADPTVLFDIFSRVGGGANVGLADTSVEINSNDVIGDHAWLWRADHGQGPDSVGWDINRSANGLVVNGNNVTYYGLFVEHFEKDITLWNGENGRDYFYQCEMPYDVPSQDAWMHGSVKGYPGFKVADNVKKFEGWGLGIYCYLLSDGVCSDNAVEVPKTPGVMIHHALTVRLGGKAGNTINNVINGVGEPANLKKVIPSEVMEYP